MRIGEIGAPACRYRRPTVERDPPVAPRALVAVEAPARVERASPRSRHPAAPFLAHLIATQMSAPQTRARRRAEPEDAATAYRAHGATPVPGRALRRQA